MFEFFLTIILLVTLMLLFVENRTKSASSLVQKLLTHGFLATAVLAISLVYGERLNNFAFSNYDYIHAWGGFHYYVGAKYFDELGYFGFYNCVLLADVDNGNFWQEVTSVRNLNNYLPVPRQELPPCPKSKFSSERWDSFVNDVIFWQGLKERIDDYWGNFFLDKGYNPTPVWTVFGNLLSNTLSVSSPVSLKLLFGIDLLLMTTALFFIYKIFSTRTMSIVVIFMTMFFGTFRLLIGNFGQYWWFSLLLFSLISWKKGKYAWSGALLAIASSLRVFPVIFIFPFLLKWLACKSERKRISSFMISGILTGAGMVFLSIAIFGWSPWWEFYMKMNIHSHYLVGELFDMGLKNFLATVGTQDLTEWGRVNLFFSRGWKLYLLVSSVSIGLVFLFVRKINGLSIFTAGAILIYILLVMSPYYYLLFVVIILGDREKNNFFSWVSQTSIFSIFLFHALYGYYWFFNSEFYTHLWSELLISLYLGSILLFGLFKSNEEEIIVEEKRVAD